MKWRYFLQVLYNVYKPITNLNTVPAAFSANTRGKLLFFLKVKTPTFLIKSYIYFREQNVKSKHSDQKNSSTVVFYATK